MISYPKSPRLQQRMAYNPQSSIIVKEQMDWEPVRFTLEWTINRFRKFRNRSKCHSSVGITMRELGRDDFPGRWRISVNPCKTDQSQSQSGKDVKKSFIGVYLQLLSDVSVERVSHTSDQSVDADFVVRVITGKEANIIASRAPVEHTFCTKQQRLQSWGFPNLISHASLFGDDKTPALLKDDSLTFVIEVTMYGEPKTVSLAKSISEDSSTRCQQFVRRQAEALANPRLQSTDFEIHSSDGQVFPTYRSLLMSHSPVFSAMLTHNSKEKLLSRCELGDVDGETVGVLLDYVYGCDTAKVTAKNAEKVLIMADKYEIVDLSAVCEGILAQSVTGENAVHCLVLASQRKLDKLKEAALNVIPKNMGTVLKNGALQEALQFDTELMQTIMEHCSKKVRVNDVIDVS